MREGSATLIRREDYVAPSYWIRSVDLSFDLDPAKTLVSNRMQLQRNEDVAAKPLRLHGEGLNLLRERLGRASALLIGPGIGREAETLALVDACCAGHWLGALPGRLRAD